MMFLKSITDMPKGMSEAEFAERLYRRAIRDMAMAIMGMSHAHSKPLKEIGSDLNAEVEKLKQCESEMRKVRRI